MAYAWYENGNIFVAYSKDVAPDTAIEVDDTVTPSDLVIDNGTLRLKTEEEKLQELKQQLLQKLPTEVSSYIYKYYPQIKQQSDISDKENGESYLAYAGLDITQLRKDITAIVLRNYPNYEAGLQLLLQKYSSKDNEMINYWLNQLLKIGYRNYFVLLVKQEYSRIAQSISSATSKEHLPPEITFTTQFPQEL